MKQTHAEMIAEVRDALRQKLKLRGRSLEVQLRNGGRLLPRSVKQDVRVLARAEAVADNPKLAKLVEPATVTQAHRAVMDYLDGIDPAAQRRDALLNMAAAVGFVILTTIVLVIITLWWRGFI
ncbi:hypothetical protein [Yoonia litorea]|uniref:Uncharacterized protein n=1 Tax=Yoonia litorea TaxID=1123755 RepID=A0A1I6MJB8_9RHOB|nr:hypothetical protein [Yoonia litorea]SFS15721.1 hypothetical protein SAMN05444714_1897 [Yoonia litorea]